MAFYITDPMDQTNYADLKDCLLGSKREFVCPVAAYISDNVLTVQSLKFYDGIPLFTLRIHENLQFEPIHYGVRCYITSLTKKRITTIDTWSKLEEAIRYLNAMEFDHKKSIIRQHLSTMVGMKYCPKIIIRAFEYYATSRSLYNRLREDFQFPSIATLTRITSKVSKLDETFLSSVFQSLDVNQRACIILHDEVYVKKMMLYHGEQLFGKSINDPSSLAQTVLGIMLICLNGGPKFLSKMIPISNLTSEFLHEQIQLTSNAINSIPADVKAIICDGNHVNRAFFKLYPTLPDKPWITIDNKHLLFDYVHLLIDIRNSWLTERMQELEFDDNGVKRVAKWAHLRQLHHLESDRLVKLSNLNEAAIAPKHVEQQRVSTCLKVFSENTYNAVLAFSELGQDRTDTAIFIKKVLTWWKIFNVKTLGANIRNNDSRQAEIRSPDDSRLDLIIEFGNMAIKMAGKPRKRRKQLTIDTATAIHHTCNGVVSLSRHLLATTHDYVLLGQFSTDPLEKALSKLRQGSDGTYFINVQQCIEKLHIKQTSLILCQNADFDTFDVYTGHKCSSCEYKLSEEGSEIFDNLENLESSLPDETKMALVYIAGYMNRKDIELNESELLSCTRFYYEQYGGYTDAIDRGGLKIPSDHACQWSFFCFILFHTIKDHVCRKSLSDIFMLISEFYFFNMLKEHAIILANIFFNNYSKHATPWSAIEPALKVLKLS